jgi:hypothetical protein
MQHGDPLLWWRLEPPAKAAALGYLTAQGMDRLEAEKGSKRRKKGHHTPDWMQSGSPLFMPELDSP